MCNTDIYTYVYPDGQREKSPPYTKLCSSARYGMPCANEAVYKHTPQQVPYQGAMASSSPSAPVNTSYLSAQYPPTPSYSSRSSTPNYHSGNESDRSGYRSGSSSKHGRSKRASTGPTPNLYVNGQPYFDTTTNNNTTTTTTAAASSSRRGDRVVVVNGPSSPRTPPTAFTAPYTAPSSPSAPYIVDANPRHRRSSFSPSAYSGRRPDLSAEVPHVDIHIRDASKPSSRKSHSRRTSSTSSYDYAQESDAARKERRRLREADKEKRRAEERAKERAEILHDRITRANAEIAGRPFVPMPGASTVDPAAYASASSSSSSPSQREAELVEAVRRLELKEEKRERRRQEKEEDEAQRQRLMERMQPRRRATVGSNNRRHRVLYDDGTYRWE